MLGLPLSKWWHGVERGNEEDTSTQLLLVVGIVVVHDYMIDMNMKIKVAYTTSERSSAYFLCSLTRDFYKAEL